MLLIVIMWNIGVIWDNNKKVLNDLVIYWKTQGSQNDQNDWKKYEKNTQILQEIQKLFNSLCEAI